ncbi:hypothetical protein Ahy_B09g095191 [Arachis hypogaea]|uniref:MATH domain-containing protein n=1 Tax=Arachis hypogaea TaxID=3818 RepID=A0A444XD45_ARAHY|nr:hypothetical protein Ahy_B09g095191 [Arachis hypogaea]
MTRTMTNDDFTVNLNDSNATIGCSSFMDIDKFLHPEKGFLVNDTCIIVAEVYLNDNNASFDSTLTKKVKDMKSDHAYMELQDLWEEVEIRFDDLSWLESHVKSALSYFKNAAKANVVDLEEKAKTLKAKAEVIAIDANLETTKKELAKAEEGFVARDLDDRLGYGIIPYILIRLRLYINIFLYFTY